MEMVGKIRSKGVVKEASSAMPSDLKYENRWQVLRVFRDGGEYTANDVAAKTGISRQTTMKAIRFFCNRGLLRSSGKGDSTDIGGKKPEHFTFYCKSYLLCIAMWPGRMGLTLFDLVRHRLDYMEGELPPYLTLEEAFERLETLSDVFLTRNGVPLSELYGVGLSTAGVVDYKSGNLRYNAYTPQWGRDVPIASRLYRLYGNQVVVYVENAAKAIGRSVLLDDESIKQKRVLTLFNNWGLAACMIERGHVLNGRDSLIGELGQMLIAADGGSPQRLEKLMGREWVVERLAHHPPASSSMLSGVAPEAITLPRVFAASAAGDSCAREIVGELACTTAAVLHNASLFFNPDLVIFHGDYACADAFFDRRLKQRLAQLSTYPDLGLFETVYDKRPIAELDALGVSSALANFFFRSDSLYSGKEE